MEPRTWEVLAVLTAAVLVNGFGFMAWRSDVVGDWYAGAVVVATLAMLVGDDFSHWLRVAGSVASLWNEPARLRHDRAPHQPA